MAGKPERWGLEHESRDHVVEIAEAGLRRMVTWRVDGELVASRTTSDDRLVLDGGEFGALGVRLPGFVGPARRVTWFPRDHEVDPELAAHVGLGGLDLVPAPGTRAAAREARIRAHPRWFVARRAAAATAGALLSAGALWLLARLQVPWPDLPGIPWPDWQLPGIPWPDWQLPGIPWPDWQLPRLPEWLRTARDVAKNAWPVLVAVVFAHAEVRRRRRQDERKKHPPRA